MAPGIEIHVPADLRDLYEIHEYRHGAALLYSEFPALYQEICEALRVFRLTRSQLIEGGGNESQIPKTFARLLRPKGWTETKMSAAMVIDDQTFDRDLFAFRSFFDYNKISVGILVTRSERLNPIFRELGISHKYGASTTHLGKLLPRLKAGRGGGCPLLIFGITELLLEAE